jgi:hypothetical protein
MSALHRAFGSNVALSVTIEVFDVALLAFFFWAAPAGKALPCSMVRRSCSYVMSLITIAEVATHSGGNGNGSQ